MNTFRFMPEKPNSIAYKRVTASPGEKDKTEVTMSELKTVNQLLTI